MNKQNCSYVMDRFLEIDKKEKIPLWMTKHFIMCEECRSNVRMYTQAEKMLSRDNCGENLFAYATLSDVKEKLYPGSTKAKRIPLIHWLIIGIFLILCMILCGIITNKFLPEIQNYFFIFVAAVITTYCMLFIGLNMDLFYKMN